MKPKYAKYLMERTKQDYEKIAEDYSLKRRFTWPGLEKVNAYVKDGDRILDWGCGHGRLLLVLKNKKIKYIGADFSSKILKIAKKNFPKYEFRLLNELSLPFSDNFFNVICSIAAFHHIPSYEFRIKLLKEFNRALKKGGFLILTSWYFYKSKKKILFKHIFKWLVNKLLGKRSELDFGDVFVPWKNSKREIIANRYFHAFTKRSLAKLVKETGFKIKEIKIIQRTKGRNNIFIVATKL